MTSKYINETDLEKLKEHYVEEKQCLLRVISTYAILAESFPEYADDIQHIKILLQQESLLPLPSIEDSIGSLRRRIFAKDVSGEAAADIADAGQVEIESLKARITQSLRLLRRVIYFFLEGFYPLEPDLEQTAANIRIEVQPDASMQDINRQVESFTSYGVALKQKIFNDFLAINETFKYLLAQVQMLEGVIQSEFNADFKGKEFQAFEKIVGQEMGAITRAFEITKNINELKSAVINKLGNIKKIIAQKKKAEIKQLKLANEKIVKLKEKVAKVEADAQKMFARAEQFQLAAMHDGLTGVHNRNAFNLHLKQSLVDLSKTGSILTLILIDVNRFKWINDTFGHVAGDKVLKVIADSLKKNFRKSDFVARYGGDEFVVLVDGLNVEDVKAGVDRFKSRLQAIKFVSHAHKTNINVEISAGLAIAQPGDSCEALLHRADQAMYMEKKNAKSPVLEVNKA